MPSPRHRAWYVSPRVQGSSSAQSSAIGGRESRRKWEIDGFGLGEGIERVVLCSRSDQRGRYPVSAPFRGLTSARLAGAKRRRVNRGSFRSRWSLSKPRRHRQSWSCIDCRHRTKVRCIAAFEPGLGRQPNQVKQERDRQVEVWSLPKEPRFRQQIQPDHLEARLGTAKLVTTI